MPGKSIVLYLIWLIWPVAFFVLFSLGYILSYFFDDYYGGCDFLFNIIVPNSILLVLCVASAVFSFRSLRRHRAKVVSGYTPPVCAPAKSTLYSRILNFHAEPHNAPAPPDTADWIRRGYNEHWWYLAAWIGVTLVACIYKPTLSLPNITAEHTYNKIRRPGYRVRLTPNTPFATLALSLQPRARGADYVRISSTRYPPGSQDQLD